MVIGGHTVNMIKRIAEGGFSEVYLARDAASSGGSGEEEYAVKWIVAQVRRVCVKPCSLKRSVSLLYSFGTLFDV